MKKSLSLILSISMFLVVLLSVSVIAQEEIVLWDITTEAESELPVIQDAIARFEADNPEYTVRQVPTSNDDYKTKLQVAMGANNEPDIFMSWGGGPLKEYVDAGKVMDMTEALKQDDWIERFVPAGLEIARFNENYYAVPITGMRAVLMFYRTDIFEEVGVEIPETYEDFKDVIVQLKDAGYIPLSLANKNRWTGSMYYMYLVDRIGGKEAFLNAASRDGGSFASEAFVRAGEVIQELVDLGAFPPGVNGLDEDQGQSRQLLYADRAAMYLMGDWAYGLIRNENPAMLENFSFFRFPVFEDGKGDPTNLVGSPGGNMYSIAKSSKHKEAAIEFLKYLSDETAAKQLVDLGNLAPFRGVEKYLDDPFMVDIYTALNNANYVQLYYDQYLPPQIAQAHLDTMQGLFGKTMTPEEAAQMMEDEAQKYFNEN